MSEQETKIALGQEIIWGGLAIAFVMMVGGLLIGAVVVAIEFGAGWGALTIIVYAVGVAGMAGFLLVAAIYLAVIMLDW